MYDLHIYFGKPGPYGIYVKGIVNDPEIYEEIYRYSNNFLYYSKKEIIKMIKAKCRKALNVKYFHTKIL